MPQFDPNFVAAYLADNASSGSKNMTEFEKEDMTEKNVANFDNTAEKNMASFDAAAEEWDAVAEVEATFGEGKKENKVAVVAAPIVTMEKVLDHLQEAWIEDYLAQVSRMNDCLLIQCMVQSLDSSHVKDTEI